MRTPGHDEDLAVGFLFTEGIIRARSRRAECRGARAARRRWLDQRRARRARRPGVTVDFKRLERNFYMTSSCGVCGKASIDAVAVQGQYDLGAVDFRMTGAALGRLPAALKTQQAVFEQTGGLHASGLFDADGHDRRAARGRRPAQRARQADRSRVAARRAAARRNRGHRQRPRELRAHAESQDGGRARSSRPSARRRRWLSSSRASSASRWSAF